VEGDRISLSLDSWEHVMNCLANQKFVGEAPPCGDAMAMDPENYRKVQEETQAVIDECWTQGMEFLGVVSREAKMAQPGGCWRPRIPIPKDGVAEPCDASRVVEGGETCADCSWWHEDGWTEGG